MTNKRVPLTNEAGDVRELISSDMRRFKPAAEVLNPSLYVGLLAINDRARRGRQKAPTKLPTTIRLSPDVMAAFKGTGVGWQTRIDDALKDWLSTHSPT